jgi:hypothetical protein
MDLVHLQSNFFPPNFSFVFWKKEFWRENNLLCKEGYPFENCQELPKMFEISLIVKENFHQYVFDSLFHSFFIQNLESKTWKPKPLKFKS